MSNANEKRLFWACFIALIATAFGFITRFAILAEWGRQFNLDKVQMGAIGGVGVWPFAISIILFSLVIDKIGYGVAMAFAFVAHITYGVIVICAPLMLAGPGASEAEQLAGQRTAYWMLYIGSLIFALGNGTVEAVINPVVATMFSREKTKWLNILHAGWPGGLVLAGLMTIAMGNIDWRFKIGLIFLPAVVYGFLMLGCKFPVSERVAAGVPYREMLGEFGVLAAIIVVGLIVRQLGEVLGAATFGEEFWGRSGLLVELTVGALLVIAFGLYVRSWGRPMLFFLMLLMIPLATTEIGTDGWITSLMEPLLSSMNFNPAWVLVYTSFIMLVLRFFAGPIVHHMSPLGLLAVSSVLAAVGLTFLSTATTGLLILAAATLYGFGKTFFWPTMLGVVSEQFPKGGALTLNAMGGVGMLAVGVLGFPFIGLLQEQAISSKLKADKPELYAKIDTKKHGILGEYEAVSSEKVKQLTPDATKAEEVRSAVAARLTEESGKHPSDDALQKALAANTDYQALVASAAYKEQQQTLETVKTVSDSASQGALATMAIFPCIMLAGYLVLIVYFRAKGGYEAQVLTGHEAKDEKFIGGVEGAMEA